VQPGVTSTSMADDAEDDDRDSSVKAASVQPDASSTPAEDDAQEATTMAARRRHPAHDVQVQELLRLRVFAVRPR
jgi:hypothetical protein